MKGLKPETGSIYQITDGISSQILGLKYSTEYIPRKTLWISGIINLDL